MVVAAFVVALAAWLAVVVRPLFQERTRARVEAERARRHRRLEDAAASLSERVDRASDLVRSLADAAPLREALEQPDAPGAARSWALVEDLIVRLAGKDATSLAVLLDDGTPLAAFHRRAAPAPSPLAAPVVPAVAGRAQAVPAGTTVHDLVVARGRAQVQAAVVVAGVDRRAVVVAEVDVEGEVSRAGDAAGEGAWALVEVGDDERVLAPAGAPLVTRPAALPRRTSGTVVEGDAIASAVAVEGVPRGAWQLRASAPARSAGEVWREVLETLLLGGAPALAGVGFLLWFVFAQRRQREGERLNRFFQTVFDAITDPLLVVDAALVVSRANQAAAARFGASVVGARYRDAVAARRADPAADEEALREVLRTGQPRRAEVQDAAGGAWQVVRYPMREGGEVTGVVEYARDVTQTRRLQAQLVQSEKLSTLGEMAAGIAHEINNPIGVMSMFAQLLQEELREALGEDAPALEKVRTIEEQAVAVGEIVQGLLRFSRKSEGPRQRLDLRAPVERALSLVEHRKALGGIALERALDVTPPPEVLGNEGQLSQVVLNLVVNAAHAMKGAGTLRLAITRAGEDDPYPLGRPFGEVEGNPERVRLAVTDTGHGIPPEALDRLFEPFFTTKPVGEGTGLGLSVSFAIIREHGGVIWVHSAPGEGTTFTLDLPAALPEAPQA